MDTVPDPSLGRPHDVHIREGEWSERRERRILTRVRNMHRTSPRVIDPGRRRRVRMRRALLGSREILRGARGAAAGSMAREIIHDSRRHVRLYSFAPLVMYYLAFNFTPLGSVERRRGAAATCANADESKSRSR